MSQDFNVLFQGSDSAPFRIRVPRSMEESGIYWVFQLIGHEPDWGIPRVGPKSFQVIKDGLASLGLTPETEISNEMKEAILAKAEEKLLELQEFYKRKWAMKFVFAAYTTVGASSELWIRFGDLLLDVKEYEEALRIFKLAGASSELIESRADRLWAKNQPLPALQLYGAVFPDGIPDEKVVTSLGISAIGVGNLGAFMRFYAQDAKALIETGIAVHRLGNFLAASHLFAAALRLTSEYPPALDQLTEEGESFGFNENVHKRVDAFDFTVRTENCLRYAGIEYIYQLAERTEAEMFKLKNYGRKSHNEIKEVLADLGLAFGTRFPKGFLPRH